MDEVESTEIGRVFLSLFFLIFLQKRIDEHRKVCYYIIKLREASFPREKTKSEGEQNNEGEQNEILCTYKCGG